MDDSILIHKIISLILAQSTVTALYAKNIKEAVAMISKPDNMFDAFFFDLECPGFADQPHEEHAGLQLSYLLREPKRLPGLLEVANSIAHAKNVPICILSAASELALKPCYELATRTPNMRVLEKSKTINLDARERFLAILKEIQNTP